MKSRSVFISAFLWWSVGAAVVGAFYPLLLNAYGIVVDSDAAASLDDRLWRVVLTGAVFGAIYGVVASVINAGLSAALARRPRGLAPLTQLIAGVWAVLTIWLMPETSENVVERVVLAGAIGAIAWMLAPAIHQRYRPMLAERAREIDEAPDFTPTHILTSAAHSDDVDAFVRTSLRTYGSGNALFTVESGKFGSDPAATEVLVDARGTGHALNLDIRDWSDKLADGAEQLPGFLVTDDRTLAIAPAGLSASAVLSEGISLVQNVSGEDDVKVQFEGFGH